MTKTAVRKILVADDDPDTRFMMSEFLDCLGFDHEVVPDGHDCVEELRRNPFTYALVLMDIHMPGISGIEASKMVRRAEEDPPSGIPIVGVTADFAYSEHDNPQKAFGINRMMSKPVKLSQLNETIQDFV